MAAASVTRHSLTGGPACSHIENPRPDLLCGHGRASGDAPGRGCGRRAARVRGGRRDHARGPAAARDPLRGDARAAADRAVRRRALGRRHVDGEEVGTGRIILLHDPLGNDAWDGEFRCVAYARAEIDVELITDPMLAAVGWTWLTDALDAHGAAYHMASGTVTRVATESFGGMAEDSAAAQLEIRASWTPIAPAEAPTRRRPAHARRRSARRGLGRAALHGGRAATGARRRGRHPEPPGTARLGDLMRDRHRPPDDLEEPRRRDATRAGAAAAAAHPSRRAAAGHRDRGRAGRGVRRDRRRHRPGRDRRRAGLGLPLLQPRLPHPAAPRGLRHLAGRPDRLRVAGPAGRGARGHRVDPARRHPGPALPRRGRAATRARCSTPSSPAGCSATRASGWPPWSRRCSASG